MGDLVEAARPLTLDEKRKLRAALDKWFDDEKGRFVEGWTDQKIGAAVAIAWGRVKVFREEFYGPLKEPDQLEKIDIEIRELHRQATELVEQTSTITRDLANRVEALERFANRIRREVDKIKGVQAA